MLSLTSLFIAFPIALLAYIVYQHYFHPLSSFPGPFLASITDFWRFYHELVGDLPSVIDEYHHRYGPFVRVAPNEITTNAPNVVDVVYTRGGRHFLKSHFYDGFTAIRPNIFGTRDEELHALRRRQMAHAFSQASLVKMEYIFDRHTKALIEKLDQRAKIGDAFDFRNVLKYFSQDCNGDLSLGVQFRTQERDKPELVPPLNDHIALAKLTGYVPWTRKWFNEYGHLIPWPYLQRLLRSRAWIRAEAARVTNLEFKRVDRDNDIDTKNLPQDEEAGRINLFNCLVRARDPDTGELIERDDITSNAITFLTAGSHSTAATLEIFWWYLCRFPNIQQRAQTELDHAFGRPASNEDLISYIGMEKRLPYTSAIFKECFRLSPTFQHPVPRVTPPKTDPKFPTIISHTVIPPGYNVSASVLSLHQNKAIWGEDANEFSPERWFDRKTKDSERLLMHFGAGHRACIGRNQSLIMIWKAIVEVMRRFDVSFAEENELQPGNIELHVCGFAELAKPLMVKISTRQ